MADGFGVDAQECGDGLDASRSELGGFDGGLAASVLFAEGVEEGAHVHLDIEAAGKHGVYLGAGADSSGPGSW